jgi:hypothetical protein
VIPAAEAYSARGFFHAHRYLSKEGSVMQWILLVVSLLPTMLPWFGQGAQRVAQTVQAVQTAQAVQPQVQQVFRPVLPQPEPQMVFHEGRWWKWDGQQWWVWVPTQTHIAQGGQVYVAR